jgi:hypothetical protein
MQRTNTCVALLKVAAGKCGRQGQLRGIPTDICGIALRLFLLRSEASLLVLSAPAPGIAYLCAAISLEQEARDRSGGSC